MASSGMIFMSVFSKIQLAIIDLKLAGDWAGEQCNLTNPMFILFMHIVQRTHTNKKEALSYTFRNIWNFSTLL
jgi:hypothetical protein